MSMFIVRKSLSIYADKTILIVSSTVEKKTLYIYRSWEIDYFTSIYEIKLISCYFSSYANNSL